MVERAWLDEGDCIIPEHVLMWKVKYIEYIETHYPSIDREVRKHLEE